jgi:tRNA A37 threonylcarbamoyladenosine modification protein TsaB
MILTIKTDQPQAELALYEDGELLYELKWAAHRQLAETIHKQIKQLLTDQKSDLTRQFYGSKNWAECWQLFGLRP